MIKRKGLKNTAGYKLCFYEKTLKFILSLAICACQVGKQNLDIKPSGAMEFEQRYIEHMYMMGCKYLGQLEEASNCAKAISYFTQAAKREHSLAQYQLAGLYVYLKEEEIIIDKAVDDQAFYWCKRAAKQGYVDAQYKLGLMYKQGHGTAVHEEKAFKWIKTAAEQNHVEAQYNLGVMYYYKNQCVTHDIRNAITYFEKAERQGHAIAPYGLGLIYKQGKGVIRDTEKAIAYFQQAAEKGCVDAQVELGIMYYKGKDIKRNRNQAIAYFKQAAETGYIQAQSYLGKIYYSDIRFRNYKQAIKYLTLAAKQGDTKSSFYLGEIYQYGLGTKANQATAIKYYTEAAKRGDVNAQYSLGMLYLNREKAKGKIKGGSEVPGSLEEAYKWLIAAANQGHEDAWKCTFELRLYFLRKNMFLN